MKCMAVTAALLLGSVGAVEAQVTMAPMPRALVNPGRGAAMEALRCPEKLITNIIAADVKPPWAAASATVTLIGAVIRRDGQRAVLECAYKAVAANYAHANLWTHAPWGACSVAPDGKSFLCVPRTPFSRS